jgi:hypothetical protein
LSLVRVSFAVKPSSIFVVDQLDGAFVEHFGRGTGNCPGTELDSVSLAFTLRPMSVEQQEQSEHEQEEQEEELPFQ